MEHVLLRCATTREARERAEEAVGELSVASLLYTDKGDKDMGEVRRREKGGKKRRRDIRENRQGT